MGLRESVSGAKAAAAIERRSRPGVLEAACKRPQYEPVYFSDCITARAAAELRDNTAAHRNTMPALHFEQAVSSYFGPCTDIAPPLSWRPAIFLPKRFSQWEQQHRAAASGWSCRSLVGDDFGGSTFGQGTSACVDLAKDGYCQVSCRNCLLSNISSTPISEHDWRTAIRVNNDTRKEDNAPYAGAIDESVTVLIASDWHVEPWYCTDLHACASVITDNRVSRFPGSTIDNMFQCR